MWGVHPRSSGDRGGKEERRVNTVCHSGASWHPSDWRRWSAKVRPCHNFVVLFSDCECCYVFAFHWVGLMMLHFFTLANYRLSVYGASSMDAVYAWPLCKPCWSGYYSNDISLRGDPMRMCKIPYCTLSLLIFSLFFIIYPWGRGCYFLTAEISGDPLETPILQRDSETRFMRCLVGSTKLDSVTCTCQFI